MFLLFRVSFKNFAALAHALLLCSSMKTTIQKQIMFIGILLQLSTLVSGCGSSSSGTATTAATSYYTVSGVCYSNTGQVVSTSYCSSTGYYTSNGYCYSSSGVQVSTTYRSSATGTYYISGGNCYNSAGTLVSSTYCSLTSSTSTTYYISGGNCYNSSGTLVASTYCSLTSSTTTTTATACYGYYYWGSELGYCYGSNCSGYTLTSASTGKTTYCE
jgi:hypothetical protein